MSDPQELDRELREYIEKEPNLRREDRLAYLKAVYNKHLEINKLEHVVNSGDLFDIIATAKGNFFKLKLPMQISSKKIENGDLTHIALIESVISYLNSMNLLKKLVKLDYRD